MQARETRDYLWHYIYISCVCRSVFSKIHNPLWAAKIGRGRWPRVEAQYGLKLIIHRLIFRDDFNCLRQSSTKCSTIHWQQMCYDFCTSIIWVSFLVHTTMYHENVLMEITVSSFPPTIRLRSHSVVYLINNFLHKTDYHSVSDKTVKQTLLLNKVRWFSTIHELQYSERYNLLKVCPFQK